MGVADRDWMRERKTDWGSASDGASGPRRGRGRSFGGWLVAFGVLVVVAVLLPRLTIDGRHWHLLFLP
jgi:hypothetical protein